jgi:hypothetical protein
MARAAIIVLAGLATLLLGWLTVFKPFLDHPRGDVLSTPGLAGLVVRQEVPVKAGSTACTSGVSLTRGTASVQYLLAGQVSEPPRVSLSVKSAGFVARGLEPAVANAGPDTFLTIPIRPASTATRVSTLCLKVRDRSVRLVGTDEGRSTVIASTAVDGRPQASDIALVLVGDRQLTNGSSIRAWPSRIASLTGVPSAIVWLLMVATVLLLTLGVLGSLAAAVVRGERS